MRDAARALAQLVGSGAMGSLVSASSGSGANLMAFDHQAHRAVLHDFVTALRTNAEPAVTRRSALQVQRLIAAMIESSNSGSVVSILP